MSLEQSIQELNKNIVVLIKLLETYPSPVDVMVDSTQVDNAVKVQEAEKKSAPKEEKTEKPEAETEAAESKYNADDLAAIAQKAIQANKTENSPKIKAKMKELNAEKVTLTPPEHIDEMYAFLESLV